MSSSLRRIFFSTLIGISSLLLLGCPFPDYTHPNRKPLEELEATYAAKYSNHPGYKRIFFVRKSQAVDVSLIAGAFSDAYIRILTYYVIAGGQEMQITDKNGASYTADCALVPVNSSHEFVFKRRKDVVTRKTVTVKNDDVYYFLLESGMMPKPKVSFQLTNKSSALPYLFDKHSSTTDDCVRV